MYLMFNYILFFVHRDVELDDTITINESFTPRKQGPRKIVITFNSNELQEVMGVTTVNVQ